MVGNIISLMRKMIEHRGKYDIMVMVDTYRKTTTIKMIYNKETKQKWEGFLPIVTRKQYNKF